MKEMNSLEPFLDIVQLRTRNRIDVQRRLCKILEDQDHIELLEGELHSLERRDFDLGQSDHREWRIGEMHQAIGSWLKLDASSERNSFECQLAEGNVHLEAIVTLRKLGQISASDRDDTDAY